MSITNHPPGKSYENSGPKRCRKCRGRVNTHSLRCSSCGVPWTPSRHGLGLARYEPEPEPPAPAVALAFPDFDDLPLGGAA